MVIFCCAKLARIYLFNYFCFNLSVFFLKLMCHREMCLINLFFFRKCISFFMFYVVYRGKYNKKIHIINKLS